MGEPKEEDKYECINTQKRSYYKIIVFLEGSINQNEQCIMNEGNFPVTNADFPFPSSEILNNCGIGIACYDLEGKITVFNDIAARFMKNDVSHFIGKYYSEVFSEEISTLINKRFQYSFKTQKSQVYQDNVTIPTGNKWYQSTYTPLVQKDKKIVGVQISSMDITALKEMEIRSLKSENQLLALFHSSEDIIAFRDKEHRVQLYNQKFADIVKKITNIEIFSGIITHEYHPRELRDAWYQKTNSVLQGQIHQEQFDFIFPDKTHGYYDIIFHPVYLNKEIIGYVEISRDITHIHQMQEEIQLSEELHRTILQNINDGVILTDHSGNFTYICTNSQRCFNIASEEILQLYNIWNFVPELTVLQNQMIEVDFIENFEIKKTFGFQNPHYFHVSIKRINFQQNSFLLMFHDVTKQKKLETELIQSQKLESLGRLAGGIAHDFNNILTGIMGYAEMLKLDFPNPKSGVGEAVEAILKGTQQAAFLTKEILGFARKGKFHAELVNVNQIVQDTLQILQNIFSKNYILKLQLQPDLAYIEGDKNQIAQIFSNLLINAKEAMPHGGPIEIITENMQLDQSSAKKMKLESRSVVKIQIQDAGTGISPENFEHLFEPFFSTKQKGTGLGLATVYGIVQNHNGYIHAETKLDEGTCFSIYLPANHQLIPMEKHSRPMAQKSQGKILVIDDEKFILTIAKRMLETLNYEVFTANSGMQGIEIYKQHMGEIDLVILDIIMPEMDGKEAFKQLKKVDPDIKVILSSGYAQNQVTNELFQLGVLDFLPKPYRLQQLKDHLSLIFEDDS